MTSLLLDADDLGLVVMEPPVVPEQVSPAIASPSPAAPVATTTRRRATKTTSNVGRGLLVFDLETIPDYSRMAQFDLDPIPEPAVRTTVEAMGNDLPSVLLKKTLADIGDILAAKSPCEEYLVGLENAERSAQKPRKGVFEAIAKVRGLDDARLELIARQRKEMSLCPEMNRIVAFGYKVIGEGNASSMVVNDSSSVGDGEVEILEAFWALAKGAIRVIGFNILGFDLPTIFVRSMILGVAPSRQFDLKPWGNDCVDLMAVRYPRSPAHGLKWLAKSLGMEIPAGDVDGSQVEELFKTDPHKVGEYVRSDVDISEAMYLRYRGFFC